jgi:hypothetical protein
MDLSFIARVLAGGRRMVPDGDPRPYAGMTRFRFKGHRTAGVAPAQRYLSPCGGAPLGRQR